MIIGGESCLGVVDMYRLVWISGGVGKHKTALAYKIAERYLQRGYRLVTNNPCVWADDIEAVQLDEHNHLKCVVIIDEGGQYLEGSKSVKMIASYPAKMDIIYLIPSIWPPPSCAQIITIQPIVSLKSTGLPVVIYKWRIKIGVYKDQGWFIWWDPSEIYGIYSRQDPGATAERIVAFLHSRTSEYRNRYGYSSDEIQTLVEVSESDKLLEAAELIASSADDMQTVFSRKNIKRR